MVIRILDLQFLTIGDNIIMGVIKLGSLIPPRLVRPRVTADVARSDLPPARFISLRRRE